ncbi:MAG: hypothetical protein QXW73_05170 [Nitrososphaerales archaeon]
MWIDLGPVPQTNWLEVGYKKFYSNSLTGDYAIYADGQNKKMNNFAVSVGTWYWYEIEDKNNDGIWSIYRGTSSPNVFVDSYNFARYSGTPRAGFETNNTSAATAEADMDQLQYYWFNYALWPNNSGGLVPHSPYNIVECGGDYHVKIKKNSVPTC